MKEEEMVEKLPIDLKAKEKKYGETIIALLIVGIVVIIIFAMIQGNLLPKDIFKEPPVITFEEQKAIKTTRTNESCEIQINTSMKNIGGDAYNVTLTVQFYDQRNEIIDTILEKVGDIKRKSLKPVTLIYMINKNCEAISRIFIDVKSYY